MKKIKIVLLIMLLLLVLLLIFVYTPMTALEIKMDREDYVVWIAPNGVMTVQYGYYGANFGEDPRLTYGNPDYMTVIEDAEIKLNFYERLKIKSIVFCMVRSDPERGKAGIGSLGKVPYIFCRADNKEYFSIGVIPLGKYIQEAKMYRNFDSDIFEISPILRHYNPFVSELAKTIVEIMKENMMNYPRWK